MATGWWEQHSGRNGCAAEMLETTQAGPRESSSASGTDSQTRTHEEWTGDLCELW